MIVHKGEGKIMIALLQRYLLIFEKNIKVCNIHFFPQQKGARGSWGERANEVLKFTKGKKFRHEKQKKKRGSYCGGHIDTHVNSIKFED